MAAYIEGRIDLEECCRRIGPNYEALIEKYAGIAKEDLYTMLNERCLDVKGVSWNDLVPSYEKEPAFISDEDIPF